MKLILGGESQGAFRGPNAPCHHENSGLEHYREVLLNLRCEANQMRDCTFSNVREAAIRMLRVIEADITRLDRPRQKQCGWINQMDPTTIPNEVILSEISRRVREIRHVPKLCTRCQRMPVRARGMCAHCYYLARKGKFST